MIILNFDRNINKITNSQLQTSFSHTLARIDFTMTFCTGQLKPNSGEITSEKILKQNCKKAWLDTVLLSGESLSVFWV